MRDRYRRSITLALLIACAGVFAPNAIANIIAVFDPAHMSQGPYTVEEFLGPGLLKSGATYSASFPGQVVFGLSADFSGGATPSQPFGLATDGLDWITVEFTQPASSVGFFFGNDELPFGAAPGFVFGANLDIFGTGGLLGTVTATANMNDFADQFIGFVSDELVTSVTLRYGTGLDVELFQFIDNVHFNVAQTSPVPAPPTAVLLLMGLAGIGFARLRSR